jgi:hypothetical protein
VPGAEDRRRSRLEGPENRARVGNSALLRTDCGQYRHVVAEKNTREARDGRLEILAWQADPIVKVICGPGGELRLEGVEIAAGQIIELPRHWDDSERKHDEHPAGQVHELFGRVRASLHAWMQAVDHLLPRAPR